MSKKLRVLSLVFVLLFLLPLFPSEVSSTGILPGPIDTSENAILKGTLEDAAEEYVTKFINTAYLYKVEDFSEGTLIEQQTRNSAAMPAQINLASGSYTTAELCENIQFFADLAGYYRYVRMANQVVRENFKLTISDVETTISADTATVKMYTLVTFRYPHLEDDSAAGEYFTVSFAKINSKWCIVDIVSEEMEVFGMNKNTFDIQEEIEFFDIQKAEMNRLGSSQDPGVYIAPQDMELQSAGTFTDSRVYNMGNAIDYAYTYATTEYTGAANHSGFINPLFGDWHSLGGNCMNYASQCIWAGFYGSDCAEAVNNILPPMDGPDAGEGVQGDGDDWFSGGGLLDLNHNWLVCDAFLEYANSCVGRTTDGIVMEVQENVSSLANLRTRYSVPGVLSGSVMLVDLDDENDPDHAIVVVTVSYVSGVEVIYCENSPMRKALSSTEHPAYFNRPFDVIVPKSHLSVYNCSGHVYEMGSGGTVRTAKCQNCGYLNLRITTNQSRPVPAGTTLTITGTANRTCYRAAIGIAYGSGSASWQEYNDVSTFSRNYTFSRTGLYTITIAVRDVNDTTNDNSNGISQVYKIRVY